MRTFNVHQLVAICFLNHIVNKYESVVNHKNFIRNYNHKNNLEIVTARENTNRKHCKGSSIYTGVCWNKNINKWHAKIHINKKQKFLGYFLNEYDAHLAYEKALSLAV